MIFFRNHARENMTLQFELDNETYYISTIARLINS